MKTFEDAIKVFETEIGSVSSKSEAEWFYVKGQLDLQEKRAFELQGKI